MPAPSMKGVYGDEGGDGAPPMPMDDMMDGEEEESEYSPEYSAAFAELKAEGGPAWADVTEGSFWRAVEACVAETGKGGGGGLAVLLGDKKGKK